MQSNVKWVRALALAIYRYLHSPKDDRHRNPQHRNRFNQAYFEDTVQYWALQPLPFQEVFGKQLVNN
jgi:hypothetical protein